MKVSRIKQNWAEKIHWENENLYRSLVENINLGITIIDNDYKIVMTNSAQSRFFNKPVNEFIGKKCFREFEKREAVCSHCPGTKAMVTKKTENVDTEGVRDDGTRFSARIKAFPFYGSDGGVKGFIEVVEDVTNQKRVEEELAQKEQELIIMNKIATIFLTVTDERMYEKVLEVVLEIMASKYGFFGYINEEGALVAISNTEYSHSTLIKNKLTVFTREQWAGTWGKALLNKKTLCMNRNLHVPEGHFPLSRTLVTPIIHQGEIVGIFTIADKPTDYGEQDKKLLETIASYVAPVLHVRLQKDRKERERKLAEEELRKFKTISDQANYGVAISDLEGHLTYINDFFAKMHGYTVEELNGKNFSIFHNGEQLRRVRRLNKALIHTGSLTAQEVWHKRKDHTVFPTLMSAVVIKNENDRPLFLSATAVDITGLKEAEKKLIEHRNRLKSLTAQLTFTEERERRHFATQLHDHIGQALFTLKIKLEMLQKSAYSKKTAVKSIDEIITWTNQIITNTRSLTYELCSPILYQLNLESALEQLVEKYRDQYGLKTSFKDDKKPKPVNEATLIIVYQGVRELLTNILKHAQAQNVRASIKRNGETIRVSVEDDGIGFNSLQIISHENKNDGFGLFSIKERLDYLGGRLDIESTPGSGTSVTMVAPLNKKSKG